MVNESRGLSKDDSMEQVTVHEKARQELLRRLRRIEGQARGVQRMVEQSRNCAEIVNQLASIRAATQSATAFLLKQYARECWAAQSDEQGDRASIEDLIDLVLRSTE